MYSMLAWEDGNLEPIKSSELTVLQSGLQTVCDSEDSIVFPTKYERGHGETGR